jgi:hypothetical protein
MMARAFSLKKQQQILHKKMEKQMQKDQNQPQNREEKRGKTLPPKINAPAQNKPTVAPSPPLQGNQKK